MQKLVRWLPVAVALGTVSCAFLLDFDGLAGEAGDAGTDTSFGGTSGTGGTGGTSGTGGVAGSGGSAGDAGDAGDGGCGKSCDDGDPCTTDSCVTPDGGAPTCVHVGKLTDDGPAVDLPVSDYLGGLSVAGGSGRFYVSRYVGTKTGDAGAMQYDTSVFEVPVSGALQKGTEVALGTNFGGAPRGPVGLVHDGTALHGFVAIQVQGVDWRVKQLSFPADLKAAPTATDLCTNGCYTLTLDGARHPQPFLGPDGKPAAMWIGSGGIWSGSEVAKPSKHAIGSAKVTDVSPVISATHEGALWHDGTDLYLTMIGGTQAKPTSCYLSTGIFQGLRTAGRGRLWSGAFSTQPLGPVVTELDAFLVEGKDWQEISNCQKTPSSVLKGVASPGMAAYKRPPTSSDERVHFAVASVASASVGVTASYIELQQGKLELEGAADFKMAGQATTPLSGSLGVDQPAVAYAGDKLLVVWRDYADKGLLLDPGYKATLRLRRFKLCQ